MSGATQVGGPHATLCPQLFTTFPQSFVPQVADAPSGWQQEPLKQATVAQSLGLAQFFPTGHFGQFGPPQSTSLSPLFCTLSLQVPPQGGQPPPQSVPVSVPSMTPL